MNIDMGTKDERAACKQTTSQGGRAQDGSGDAKLVSQPKYEREGERERGRERERNDE
jgi:hypothetical protein